MSSKTSSEVEQLIRRFQGSVRGFLVVLGCPADRVDDLVQDTFLSFLSSRFEERGDPATRAFLRRIARNLLLKSLERERRQIVVPDLASAEGAWARFEAEDGGDRYLVALRHCLRAIRGRAEEVLRLRYEENVRVANLAERVGLSESGVKSILVRSKRKLRTCIQRRLGA